MYPGRENTFRIGIHCNVLASYVIYHYAKKNMKNCEASKRTAITHRHSLGIVRLAQYLKSDYIDHECDLRLYLYVHIMMCHEERYPHYYLLHRADVLIYIL